MSSPPTPTAAVFETPSPGASSVSSYSDFPGFDSLAIDDALLRNLLSKIDLKAVESLFIEVAKLAGEMMLAADPSVEATESKLNSCDIVTQTDKDVQDMVAQRLSAAYPAFKFCGEETYKPGDRLTDDPTFVCDPIDGTLNFFHGHSNYCISLALTVAKRPVVGVIYAPALGCLYTAVKGQGAYLTRANGSRVELPYRRQPTPLLIKKSLGIIEWGKERAGENWALRTSVANKLMTSEKEDGAMCHSIRSNGSCALSFCFVASGQCDFMWESGCWIWDVCAGWLIVEEAGGIVAGANPGEWEPTLEGRSYFPVRAAAPSGQREVVNKVWDLMKDRSFGYAC